MANLRFLPWVLLIPLMGTQTMVAIPAFIPPRHRVHSVAPTRKSAAYIGSTHPSLV